MSESLEMAVAVIEVRLPQNKVQCNEWIVLEVELAPMP